MKVATILAEKAAEVEQAVVAEAQARIQAEVDAAAAQKSVMTETAVASGSTADAAMPDAQVRPCAQVTAIETAGSPAEGVAGAEAEATTEEEWQDCREMPTKEQLQQSIQLQHMQQQKQRSLQAQTQEGEQQQVQQVQMQQVPQVQHVKQMQQQQQQQQQQQRQQQQQQHR